MSTANPEEPGVSGHMVGETGANAANGLGVAGIHDICNGVIPFIWDRLQLSEYEHNRIPALAEDWFVEEALALGSPFVWRKSSPEHSHRLLYRHARKVHIEEWGRTYPKPEWAMLDMVVNSISGLAVMARVVQIAQSNGVLNELLATPTPQEARHEREAI